MEIDLELSIAEMFRDATMENVILELRTEADWERFNGIKEAAAQSERQEIDRFETVKPQLLAKNRQELLRQAGSKTHDLPPPIGADRFSETNLERRANAIVENDHKSRLLKIKNEEADGYSDLKQDIQTREGVRDLAHQSFARAVDRRAPTRSR